jgi:hypothetical protein
MALRVAMGIISKIFKLMIAKYRQILIKAMEWGVK